MHMVPHRGGMHRSSNLIDSLCRSERLAYVTIYLRAKSRGKSHLRFKHLLSKQEGNQSPEAFKKKIHDEW